MPDKEGEPVNSGHVHGTIEPLGIKSRPDGGTSILWEITGPSQEVTDSVAEDLAILTGAESVGRANDDDIAEAQIELEAARTGKAAYFSSNRWRAPWQPTGPTPPGEYQKQPERLN